MRVDRLVGIIMYLLNRNVVPARELADRFEVSVRTIVRDVEALNLAGVPVSSSAGASGGYEILDTFKLNKPATGADDYLYVITALKGMFSAYGNKKLEATLEKLLAAGNCKKDGQRIFLDFGAAREGENTPAFIELLDEAIHARNAVDFEYTDSQGRSSRRTVEPLALAYKWYAWYLFGYCSLKKDYRIFKLNRIRNLFQTKAPFTRSHPDTAGILEDQWRSDRRNCWDVKLLCKAETRIAVMEYLNGAIMEECENGDFVFSLRAPENERIWFSVLLGFGDNVEVLEPQELKQRLLQKAREIQKLYDK